MPTKRHRIQVTKDRETKRQELLEKLAHNFRNLETAPWSWEVLRNGKRRAWPIR